MIIGNNDFYFVDRKSTTLLVTVGDSTTKGVDLTDVDDCYGAQLAKTLDADFLNMAEDFGVSNFWMTEQIEKFSEIIDSLNYQKIYVICLFTEPGRWFDTEQDRYIDYFTWLKENINKPSDYYKLLEFLNKECINRIYKALDPHNVKLFFGTHVSDPIGFDAVKDADRFDKTMLKIITEHCGIEYTPDCYVFFPDTTTKRFENVLELQPALNKNDFLTWYIETMEIAALRRDLVKGCGYFTDGCHPSPEGHKMIANYILETIKNAEK